MSVNEEMRKVLWEAFKSLEFKLQDIKSVVQNEMEFDSQDIEDFAKKSNDFIQEYNVTIVATKSFMWENKKHV